MTEGKESSIWPWSTSPRTTCVPWSANTTPNDSPACPQPPTTTTFRVTFITTPRKVPVSPERTRSSPPRAWSRRAHGLDDQRALGPPKKHRAESHTISYDATTLFAVEPVHVVRCLVRVSMLPHPSDQPGTISTPRQHSQVKLYGTKMDDVLNCVHATGPDIVEAIIKSPLWEPECHRKD